MRDWDSVLQLLGILTGAAGAYFAYRQYKISRPSPGAATGAREPAELDAGNARFEAQIGGAPAVGSGIMLLSLAIAFIAGLSDRESQNWQLQLIVIGLFALGVWACIEERVTIFLDKEAMTMQKRSGIGRRLCSYRFPWSDLASIYRLKTPERLVLRLRPELGLGPTRLADLRDRSGLGFLICETRRIQPSERDLLIAVAHYSTGRIEVK
jgi:hypothetical protein